MKDSPAVWRSVYPDAVFDNISDPDDDTQGEVVTIPLAGGEARGVAEAGSTNGTHHIIWLAVGESCLPEGDV